MKIWVRIKDEIRDGQPEMTRFQSSIKSEMTKSEMTRMTIKTGEAYLALDVKVR